MLAAMPTVVETYQITPGCCALCGGAHTPAIDTGRDYDPNWPQAGLIYICHFCVCEMGRAFGMSSFDEVVQIRADASEELLATELALKAAESSRDSYKARYEGKSRAMAEMFNITKNDDERVPA